MVRPVNGRHLWLVACAALVAMAMTLPAAAQSTGMVRGVVKDAAGKTVEGAKVIVEAEGNNRRFETKIRQERRVRPDRAGAGSLQGDGGERQAGVGPDAGQRQNLARRTAHARASAPAAAAHRPKSRPRTPS